MAAYEIACGLVELGDTRPAYPAVHDARADEIGPSATISASRVDDADALVDVLPIAASDTYVIAEVQAIERRAQVDPSGALAISRPLPDAGPPGRQAAFAVETIYVERAAAFHFGATSSALPSRPEPTWSSL
jgi:hypothetical protein